MNENILVVDDDPSVLGMIGRLLEMNGYHCTLAGDAAQGRECLQSGDFELVLCDVNMPGESGMDFARYVLSRKPDTAVVMVTGVDDTDMARTAFEMGTYGYMIKPFKLSELIINVGNALRRRELEIESKRRRATLERIVEERTEELHETLRNLQKMLDGTIQAMALTVEVRDPYTAGHQRRVAVLASAMAEEMGLDAAWKEGLYTAALIHDLGKISVPSEILSKPGDLTVHEFGIVQAHAEVGYDILKTIEFPWPVAEIVRQHHERLDGSGYPRGLKGDEILLEARILGAADTVDAMSSHRPYRPSLGLQEALAVISRNGCGIYDAGAVDACLKLFNEKGFRF